MLIWRKRLFLVAVAFLLLGAAFLILPPYAAYCEGEKTKNYYCSAYELTVTLRPFLFPVICFHVWGYDLRGGGATLSGMASLFCVIASLFSRPKFPVRVLRESRPIRPEYRDN
jgi:hypothetical protein